MQKHMKRMLGYLLAITIFISDIPIVVNAEENAETGSQAAETVLEIPETEDTASTPKEAHIISELTEKRDETTKYFAMSDGTTKACIYPQNIHYLDEGEYKEIDNTLVKELKDGKTYYKNKKNNFSVKIPENYTDDYIKFSDENGYVKFKLKGATNKKLEKIEKEQTKKNKDKTLVDNVNDKAIFKSVKANVDIEYDVTGNKLKETIVLYKKTKNSFIFDIRTSADKAILNNDNSVSFLDEDGNELYTIESPYMVDSAGEYSNDIKTTLLGVDDRYTITYKPNYEWLSAKERVYPVKIDPTMFQAIYKETVADTYVTNAQTASDTRGYWDIMNIGKRNTTTGGQQIVLRGLIKFDIPSEIGSNDCIVDAKLDLVHCNYEGYTTNNGIQIDVHELKQPFSEGDAWWGNQPTYDPIITDYAIVNTGNYFSGTSLSYDSYNLTKLVNKWHNGETNHGIILKLHDDSSNVSTRQQVYYFAKQSTYYGTVSKFVEITYRNAVGLEDYWSYTTQDFGQYGTGYVNNYNGNLVYVHEDTSFNSLINGFTLSHVYNTNLAGAGMGYYGSGWRLNLVQKFEPITVTGNSSVKYVYTDGDGTRHYFVETSDGKIVDEDGLGYTFASINETMNNGTTPLRYQITSKNKTILKFDMWHFLRQIVDSNGNTIYLNYSPGSTANLNMLTSIGTSSGGYISLSYDNNNLSYIMDNVGRKTNYIYSSGDLIEIQYPDGTVLKTEYNSGGSHQLNNITSPDNRVLQYKHYSVNGKISNVKLKGTDGSFSSDIVFSYLQNQTQIIFFDERSITYQFDTLGRATCIYDDEQKIYSQTYNTSSTTQTIFCNNKLSSNSNGQVYVNNLLSNAVFANDLTGWVKYQENSNSSISIGNIGLITSKSVKIESSGNTIEAILQAPTITSTTKTFTLSGYIKTENVHSLSHGAALEIVVKNNDGGWESYFSEFILGTTDDMINNGFQHISVTYTLNEGESIERIGAGLYNSSGIVYIDSLQLEEGNTSNYINIIDNSSFEKVTGSMPTAFISNHNDALCGVVTSEKKEGRYSFINEGASEQNRYLVQQYTIAGKAGDVYSFGGWIKGDSIPEKGSFGMVLHFANIDGSDYWTSIEGNKFVENWQYIAKTVIAPNDFWAIEVYCAYGYNVNTAYFDNIFLYRDTMQSYTYDSNGNVITTSDYASQNETFQYKNNNLSKLINPNGSSYEYLYDSKNNMTFARSGEGITYDVEYDSQGNAISTKIENHSYSYSIQDEKTYYIRLKNSGKYLTVEGSGTSNYTNVIQENFTGGDNQKWTLEQTNDGYYCLHPAYAPNMSLDLIGGTGSTDRNLALYSNLLSDSQKYYIKPQNDYTYQLETKCFKDNLVTVFYSSTQNNVSVVPIASENNPDQEWYFEDVEQTTTTEIEDGTIYQFRARHSGKYINLVGGYSDIGTLAQQYESNFTSAQKYRLNRYEDTDYYTFTTCIDNDKKIEISSDVNSIGYKYLRLGDNTITDSKLFKLEYHAGNQGFYIIPKVDETLALDVAYYSTSNNASLIFTGKAPSTNRFFIAEKFSDTITTSATYQDNGNYPHTVTDARGYTTTYTYDTSRGLQTGVTDAKGTTTTYAYNVLNDRLELVASGNSTVSYQYETNGALKKITTPSGSVYNFFYDVFGRTSRIAIGNTTLSETTYKNNSSSLVSRFDYGNGAYKTYEYDNQDRLVSEGVNGTTTRTYIYDKQGNTAQTTDHLTNATTTYTYDLIGRISRIKSSDGHTTNFIYDTYNRLSLSKWSKGDITLRSSYIYDDNSVENQKTGLIYGIKLNGTQQLGYEYDELARLQRRLLYTTTPFSTEYTYMEGASANTTTTLVKTVKNGNDTLEYTYDEIGNVTSVSKNGTIIEQYAYDALNQLTSAIYGGNTYMYSYDNGGNLTEIKKNDEVIKTYTYGNSEWTDQLTGYNDETITYDAIGNPLIYRNGINFTWQHGRQLGGITQNGSTVATYTYNADGLRNSKIVNGITTEYYWQNGTLYGQKSGDESIFYLYDEKGSTYGFIYKNSTEQLHYYYEFNLQGDIIGIIDSTGTRVVEYTYGAWGDILSVTGTLADTIGQKNPLRYRGYYYDAETGFYYVSSRYYDPEIGRFLNADSLINQSSVIGNNMFAYCLNNPVNMADNTGNLPFFVVTAAIGAVAGAIYGGIKAAKNGGNVWAGIGIGAAVGGLVGAGFGAVASATLAGSVAATTTKVAIGVGKLATAVTTGGLGAGATYIANNISQVINSGGGQVASQTGKNVYYQVTSSQAAQTIADTTKLIPSPVEGSVCVLNFQPTLTQARQLGAQSVETVIRFSTNCTTFVPDLTVPYSGAYRNMINGAIQIFDVVEVGFR